MKGKKQIRELYQNDYFGEIGILFGTKRTLSVIATENTLCYQISQGILKENLGDNFLNIILESIVKNAFEKSKYLKLLAYDNYFHKVFPVFAAQFYKNKSIVVTKQENERKLLIVIEGNLFVYFYIIK